MNYLQTGFGLLCLLLYLSLAIYNGRVFYDGLRYGPREETYVPGIGGILGSIGVLCIPWVPNWLAIVVPFLDAGFTGGLGAIVEIIRYSRAPKYYHCTEDVISFFCDGRPSWTVHAEEIREVQYKTKEIWIIKKGIPTQLFRISPKIDGSEQVEQFLKERGF